MINVRNLDKESSLKLVAMENEVIKYSLMLHFLLKPTGQIRSMKVVDGESKN